MTKEKEINYFSELAKIDVGNYIEKKGQFSYLSWVYAIDQLRRYDPTATWKVLKFPNANGVELPYMLGPNGGWVEVEVTVKGVTLSSIQPIMDFKNKSISNPDAMDVNKAIQRCIVKGIALHGLGLYIYAGEDLPNNLISAKQLEALDNRVEEFASLRGGEPDKVWKALGIASPQHLQSDQADMALDKVAMWIDKAKEEKAKEEAEAQQAPEAQTTTA